MVPANCRDQQLGHVDGEVPGVREERQVPGAGAGMRSTLAQLLYHICSVGSTLIMILPASSMFGHGSGLVGEQDGGTFEIK